MIAGGSPTAASWVLTAVSVSNEAADLHSVALCSTKSQEGEKVAAIHGLVCVTLKQIQRVLKHVPLSILLHLAASSVGMAMAALIATPANNYTKNLL